MIVAFLRKLCGRSYYMLNLKKLLEGAVERVDLSLALEDCSFIDDAVSGSAVAKGVITNHSGFVLLEGEITAQLLVSCARCGREFNYKAVIPLNAKITEALANEDEDEFIILTDYEFDEEDLVRSTLILELPGRYLCNEDCKGLCPKCGCDLNEGLCQCNTKEADPRWDVLKDYFSE